jgi:hypothetical protein
MNRAEKNLVQQAQIQKDTITSHPTTPREGTLTTEAPVANFFPSFFEASLSFTPKGSGKNI